MTSRIKKGPARHGQRAGPPRSRPRLSQCVAADINTDNRALAQPDSRDNVAEILPETIAQVARDAARAAETSEDRERLLVLAAVAGLVATGASLTLQRAAALAAVSPQTLASWAIQHQLGRKLGGRWIIDARALVKFLSAGDEQPGVRGEGR